MKRPSGKKSRSGKGGNDIDKWVEFVATLEDQDQFNLVGLLEMYPDLDYTTIDRTKITGEMKTYHTSNWAAKNFREALYFYCRLHNTTLGPVGLSAVGVLAPLVASQFHLTLGAAVGFAAWSLNYGLDKWCGVYSETRHTGLGRYYGDIPGDVRKGTVNLTHRPAISEVVKSKTRQTLPAHEIRIHVPASITGLFDSANGMADGGAICRSLRGEAVHIVEVDDLVAGKRFSCSVENVTTQMRSGSCLLDFTAANLRDKKLRAKSRVARPKKTTKK